MLGASKPAHRRAMRRREPPEGKVRLSPRGSVALLLAAVYGQQDSIHRRWLREAWGLQPGDYPCHVIPDSTALFGAVCAGLAYGLVPLPQARDVLERGLLCELAAGEPIGMPLFWHHWNRQTAPARVLADAVALFAGKLADR